MKIFKFNKIVLAMVLTGVTNLASAALSTDCAVMPNDANSRLSARANFSTPIRGDLYIATKVDGQFLFFAKGGQETSLDPLPFAENTEYSGDLSLFDFSAAGIAPGRYPLFQVVTNPGTDPLDFTNWVGGLSGLSSINFNIGLPVEVSGDFNGDCFADNDLNRDGFRDDDLNKDGFADDDLNKDGFSADDLNRDGFHDDDLNRDGFRDDDLNKDGFADDDLNRDGFADDDLNRDGFHDNDLNRDGFRDDDLNKDGFRDDDLNRDGFADNDLNRDGFRDDDLNRDGFSDGNDSETRNDNNETSNDNNETSNDTSSNR